MRKASWIAIAFGLASSAYAQSPEPPAIPVATAKVERKPVAKIANFVGRISGIEKVDVRARVTGYLDQVLFKEGDIVKAGDPLYRIEKSLFQAAVERAQGTLEIAKAADALADIQLQRAEELLAKSAGTVVARDQAQAQKQQTTGSLMTSQADLDTAKVNLSYTDIIAPITGRIGLTNLTKGNVVGPDSGVLATIISQDPIYVIFPVSQREFLKAAESGQHTDPKNLSVRIRFSDGTEYDQPGQIDFLNNFVDRGTDTVLARAKVPNPSGTLTDGQLVRVDIAAGSPSEMVVVPQSALIADQGGSYVFAVENGKAVIKRVRISATEGTNAVIADGLAGGEQIIVQGLQAVRPGAAVRPREVAPAIKGN